VDVADEYYRAAEVLEARDTLVNKNIALLHISKDEYRKKFHKDVYKVAYPSETKKILTNDELARMLNG